MGDKTLCCIIADLNFQQIESRRCEIDKVEIVGVFFVHPYFEKFDVLAGGEDSVYRRLIVQTA